MNSGLDPRFAQATPEQLANLLALSIAPAPDSESVPPIVADAARCRARLASIRVEAYGTAESLLDDIGQGNTSLDRYERMMGAVRELLREQQDPESFQVLTLVYHACTAAAFVEHGARLTKTPIEARLATYESLAAALADRREGEIFAALLERVLAGEGGAE